MGSVAIAALQAAGYVVLALGATLLCLFILGTVILLLIATVLGGRD